MIHVEYRKRDEGRARVKASKKLVGWFVLTALVGCENSKTASTLADSASPPTRQVQLAAVTERALDRKVVAIGSIAAHELATLSVKVAGRLHTIAVDLGSHVEAGQLIAQVERADYELRLAQAEAMLSQARARLGLPAAGESDDVDLEQTSTVKEARARLDEARKNRNRVLELYQQNLLSESDRELVESAFEVAATRITDALEEVSNRRALLTQRRVEVDIARKQLADTAIYAPFAGAIQARIASPGEYLAVGSPVATIVCVDPLRLRVEVAERDAIAIRVGQSVRIWVEGGALERTGVLHRVSPAIDPRSRMLLVEADLPKDETLRPGSFVRAEITTVVGEKSVSIPLNAVTTFAGIEKVFVVANDKAVERAVTTGRRGADWIEIVRGLKLGEQVVQSPGNLAMGERVSVRE
ncbi:MAG: efflux RND transporter periplasmic adaptor subunit [Planctomycetota bacterium]